MVNKILCLILMTMPLFAFVYEEGIYGEETGPNEFSLLTYNIAGLPQGISKSNPWRNTPKIAVKINLFDIVLVQEDFFYHYFMRRGDAHPYKSVHDFFHGTLGDGLNRFSYCEFFDHERIPWDECYGFFDYGSDCLTPKGFSMATHEVSPGIFIDIYNLHMDAGKDIGSHEARAVETDQLIEKLLSFSDNMPVIVVGDFNMRHTRPEDNTNLEKLISSTQLIDAHSQLGIAEERIDKIFYRSSDSLKLSPSSYNIETDVFADENGEPLSDHDAISILFTWEEI